MSNQPLAILIFLFASFSCFSQNVELSMQSDVDLFDPSTTIINGDLIVGSTTSDIVDLSNLSNLQTVTGNLNIAENPVLTMVDLAQIAIVGKELNVVNNEVLASFQMPALKSVTEHILIESNPLLSNIMIDQLESVGDDLDMDVNLMTALQMQELQSIAGNLALSSTALVSLDISKLASIGGTVRLPTTPALEAFNAPLLAQIGGSVQLQAVENMTTINLPELQHIGIDLKISGSKISDINLENLETINGDIFLSDLNLETISFPKLGQTVGDILITNNGDLKNIEMPLVEQCVAFQIESNPTIENLDGFSNLKNISGTARINDNHSLVDINGLDQLVEVLGNLYVSNNDMINEISFLSLINVDGEVTFGGELLTNVQCDNLTTIESRLAISFSPNIHFPALMTAGSILLTEIIAENIEFPTLTTVEEDLTISQIDHIQELIFPSLVSVKDDLNFYQSDDLITIQFPNLTQLGGVIVQEMDLLEEISFPSIRSVEDNVTFAFNPNIINIDFSLLDSIGGGLFIEKNGSLSHLDNLGSLNHIERNCTINENLMLNNFDGLINLSQVNGNLVISSNPLITHLNGLSSLVSVGKSFDILLNEQLVELEGLSNLRNINSAFRIKYNHQVKNFEGLENLVSIGGILEIEGDGFEKMESFQQLSTLGGLLIARCPSIKNISNFSLIDTIPNACIISSLEQLEELSAFENLQFIGNAFSLQGLDSLRQINTFNNLEEVGFDFSITFCDSLTTIESFLNLKNIGGHLFFRHTNASDLYHFENLVSTQDELFINMNPILSDCCGINQLLFIPGAVGGEIILSDNLKGCLNETEVLNSFCDNYEFAIGNVYVDPEQDGCDGTNNFSFAKLLVESDLYSFDYLVNSDGAYRISLPIIGDYTITPQISSYHNVTPESLSINNPDDLANLENDFCISPNGDFKDLRVDLIPLNEAQAGFVSDYKIIYQNIGTVTLSGKVVFTYDGAFAAFESADPNPDLIDLGLLEWQYEDLAPFEQREIFLSLQLNSPQDTPPLIGGEVLRFQVILHPFDMDENRSDNISSINQEVVNSFDPNDKTCLEGDYFLDEDLGDYITYLIRFENIGTASAVNIVVKDSIDPKYFDIRTLNVIDASHEMYTVIEGDIVRFLFEDIYLPFEDEQNDGYIFFEIKTRENIELGEMITNSADIFFDFNDAIVTNTTSSTVVTDQDGDGFHHLEDCDDDNDTVYPGAEEIAGNGIDEDCDGDDLSSTVNFGDHVINVFPNPSATEIKIITEEAHRVFVSLLDITGKLVKTCQSCKSLNVSELKAGTYLLKLEDQKNGLIKSLAIIVY